MRTDLIRELAMGLVLGFASASVLWGQEQPDFSGMWVLETTSPGPNIPRALSVRQSIARTNVRGEPISPYFKDVTITRVIGTDTSSETHQIGVVGGSVPGRPAGSNDRYTWHRVGWEDQTLVFEHGTSTGASPESGDWTAQREVWSLDSGGRLQVTITTRSAVEAPRTTVWVYHRR